MCGCSSWAGDSTGLPPKKRGRAGATGRIDAADASSSMPTNLGEFARRSAISSARRVPRDLAMRCLALLLSMLAAPTCGLRLGSVSRCNAPVAALAASPATVDPATLPGDPSLILTTNVKLSDKKAFMTAASAAIASSLSKPESYVAVAVTDSQDLIFGGSDAPCALGCGELYLGLAERPWQRHADA